MFSYDGDNGDSGKTAFTNSYFCTWQYMKQDINPEIKINEHQEIYC